MRFDDNKRPCMTSFETILYKGRDLETLTDEEILRLMKWTHMGDWSLSQIKEMTVVAQRDPV